MSRWFQVLLETEEVPFRSEVRIIQEFLLLRPAQLANNITGKGEEGMI